MRQIILLLIFSFVVSAGFAQQNDSNKKDSEEQKGKLLESLNLDSYNLKIPHPETQLQEQVKVEAEEYPGLNMAIENPAQTLAAYKPYTKQQLRAYADLIIQNAIWYDDGSGRVLSHVPPGLYGGGMSK